MTFKSAVPIALFAAIFLGGCGSSPKTNFYTLNAQSTLPRAGHSAAYSVAIGAVTLPDGIDRPQLVVRTGANRVSIADFERWAGPLKDEIAYAVAENLTGLLDGANVFILSRTADLEANYTVLLDVQRFDSVLGDAANIDVVWRVRPAAGAPKGGRSVVREAVDGPGYDALVAAYSRALSAVSRDIASSMQAVSSPSK